MAFRVILPLTVFWLALIANAWAKDSNWVLRGVVCADPPYPDRNSCHGTQVVGAYETKELCLADRAAVLKRRFPGYRVTQTDQDCELKDW
jgi:hypothetical protein